MLKRPVKLLGESASSTPGLKRQLQVIEQEMLSDERNSHILRFQPFRKAKQPK